jgi:hypothetical protein
MDKIYRERIKHISDEKLSDYLSDLDNRLGAYLINLNDVYESIMQDYPELSKNDAENIMLYWMITFSIKSSDN